MKKLFALLLAGLLTCSVPLTILAEEVTTDGETGSEEETPEVPTADKYGTSFDAIDYGDTVIGYNPAAVEAVDTSEFPPLSAFLDFPENKEFTIGTPAELVQLSEYVNAGVHFAGYSFYLTNDLDMTNVTMRPIGITPTGYGTNWQANDFPAFSGTFDAQGHVIDNLVMTSDASADNNDCYAIVGLFGCSRSATIKNLVMGAGCSFSYTGTAYYAYVASIVAVTHRRVCAMADGVTQDPDCVTRVINCYTAATVESTKTAGGIAAWCECNAGSHTMMYGSWFTNCTNAGRVSGKKVVGGILAYAGSSRAFYIENCRNTGEIVMTATTIKDGQDLNPTVTSKTSIYGAGGILGLPTNAGGFTTYIKNCINNGAISGPGSLGGIVGTYKAYWLEITGCSNYGTVGGTDSDKTTTGCIIGRFDTSSNKISGNADLSTVENATDSTLTTISVTGTFPNYDEVKAAQDAWVAERLAQQGGNEEDTSGDGEVTTTAPESTTTPSGTTEDNTQTNENGTTDATGSGDEGCASSVSASLAILVLVGAAGAVVIGKKQDR